MGSKQVVSVKPRVGQSRVTREDLQVAPDAIVCSGVLCVTVMFPRYFGVPQRVIREDLWPEMKPSEQSLYVCLLYESERYSTRELRRTDGQLRTLSGVSPRAFCNARKKLKERGLILYQRGRGNVYIYTICDPETGLPWTGDPKKPMRYKKKADAPNEESLQAAVPTAGWKENRKPAASFATPARSAAPSPSSPKPNDRLEEYGLPGVFK